ncbi:carbonic anhydrase [Microbacterium sp. NPDC055910]|uniref:carbonic anhydrase n=1 Tax=Microbacterium sp. NPDC055910 TaxID=3345659 RepID=UPI0035DAC711
MNGMPTPQEAWDEMRRGNERFVAGAPRHPHQGADRRHELATGQRPHATLFGCSDSRLAAEIIFDKGLGDLFVIRNVGQVISESVVGSIEYAVEVLEVPLIVVLGHDECGAVAAAIESTQLDAPALAPQIWRQIAPIVPAARRVIREQTVHGIRPEKVDPELVGREHLRDTVSSLLNASELISLAVAEQRVGIVGANYRLAEGLAAPAISLGVSTDA